VHLNIQYTQRYFYKRGKSRWYRQSHFICIVYICWNFYDQYLAKSRPIPLMRRSIYGKVRPNIGKYLLLHLDWQSNYGRHRFGYFFKCRYRKSHNFSKIGYLMDG